MCSFLWRRWWVVSLSLWEATKWPSVLDGCFPARWRIIWLGDTIPQSRAKAKKQGGGLLRRRYAQRYRRIWFRGITCDILDLTFNFLSCALSHSPPQSLLPGCTVAPTQPSASRTNKAPTHYHEILLIFHLRPLCMHGCQRQRIHIISKPANSSRAQETHVYLLGRRKECSTRSALWGWKHSSSRAYSRRVRSEMHILICHIVTTSMLIDDISSHIAFRFKRLFMVRHGEVINPVSSHSCC